MKRSRNIFRGRRLSLFIRKYRLPNGCKASLEVVEHPGAALIIPFLSRNKVIMLRQLRPVIGAYIHELPAGTLERGERPLSCAKRELMEETGYSAGKLTRLGRIYTAPGYTTENIVIFKAEKLKPENVSPEADEVITHRVFDKNTIQRLLRMGKIRDAKTICAFALCGWADT